MDLLVTDDYGLIPKTYYRKWRKAGVTPAEYDTIVDAFELIAETDIDYLIADRWISRNLVNGLYEEPWPLNPVDIVTS